METLSYEGIVEDGQIQLAPDIHLPEKAKVIVHVQSAGAKRTVRIGSPRLVHPEQAAYFVKEMEVSTIKEKRDAGV